MVAGNALHAERCQLRAAEKVAATDDDGDFHARIDELTDFAGDAAHHFGIQTEGLVAHQRLAAHFQQNSFVFRGFACAHVCVLR